MPGETVAEIFERLRQKLEPVFARLPAIIGEAGVNYSLDAFEKQGFEGVPWKERKSKKDTGRAILVKSGALRRSIRIVSTSENSVTWGTDLPYAQVHNDGLPINRAARSETFIRPRYKRGDKGKMFGGMGAFRKITAKDRAAAPKQGQSYKAYSYMMPQRRFLGNTPALRSRLKQVAIEELQKGLKGL